MRLSGCGGVVASKTGLLVGESIAWWSADFHLSHLSDFLRPPLMTGPILARLSVSDIARRSSRFAPRNEDQEPTHPAPRCLPPRHRSVPGLRAPVRRLALAPSTARHRSDVRRAPASPRSRYLLRLRHVPPPLAIRIHCRSRAHWPGGRDRSDSKHSSRSDNSPALLHACAGTAKRPLRLRPPHHLHPRRPAPLLPRGRLAYSAATPPPL